MGTGLSHLYAIPVGVAFAVPILEFNWYNVNEETLVSAKPKIPIYYKILFVLFIIPQPIFVFHFLSSLQHSLPSWSSRTIKVVP